MASSLGYVQYVASQLADAGVITYKKLFGEYGLWCGGKFFGTVEDNLVENLDDADFLAKLVIQTCEELPEPKAKKKAGKAKKIHGTDNGK